MISQQQAAPAILRLSVLPFFNALMTEAREELVNTLAAVADDQGHAGRIVSDWLSEQSELPTPAQLREMAKQSRLANPSAIVDHSCECGGTGFVAAWYLGTMRGHNRPPLMEFLAPLNKEGHYPPEVAAVDDELTRKGIHNQQVVTGARRCTACSYGQRLALAKQMAEHEQPEPKRRR
jgi:hypothetical protein